MLYLGIGRPKKALGKDIGDGLIVRIKPGTNQAVGLTIVGLRDRVMKAVRV